MCLTGYRGRRICRHSLGAQRRLGHGRGTDSAMPCLWWNRLSGDEIAAVPRDEAVVLVPFGAIEQHGPHLPVNTDTVIASAVCELAADLSHRPVLVLPVTTI